jgi:hypothetical protein
VPEILALLTAKTASTEFSGGGIAKLTPEMVAAACSGLNERAYLFALLKYTQDLSVNEELFQLMVGTYWRRSHRYKWRMGPGEGKRTIERMVCFAIREACGVRLCKTCNGSGNINNKGVCHVCKGTGNGREISERVLADVLGVSHKRVRLFWRDKFRDVQSYLIGLDYVISEKLRDELRE